MGAMWKLSNSEQAVPTLKALPHGVWLALMVIEVACALALVVPAVHKPLAWLVPMGAAVVAAEMLLFSSVHLASGASDHGPMIYWLVVAALCSFVAYGRFSLRPL
jgi:hypothetical protein